MKKIIVKDKYDNKYTLEFTADTVMQVERAGFKLGEAGDKPMTSVRMLFEGAFLANHKNVKPELVTEMLEGMKNKAQLIEKLMDMYREPYETLMDESAEGNATWECNW